MNSSSVDGARHTQPTAEQIAEIVAGIPAIGVARDALQEAGWRATIAGNRITVNDKVLVHFISAFGGAALVIDAHRPIHSQREDR